MPGAALLQASEQGGAKKLVNITLKGQSIVAGDGLAGVIDVEGRAFTWGKQSHRAALGHDKSGFLDSRVPHRIEALQGKVTSLSLGGQHGAAALALA